MSGIYIHIPFCKKACIYCDFHFSTSLSRKEEMVNAICKEIEIQHTFLNEKKLRSIYFGGGTPSVLSRKEQEKILNTISQYFELDEKIEITLEANPDDLNAQYLKELSDSPINRLSIGVQSFREEDLKLMNRSHNAEQAISSIKMAQDFGFHNITLDLIYAMPGMSNEVWKEQIKQAVSLGVPHISSYALTVEPKTILAHKVSKGEIKEADESIASEQFEILWQTLENEGFEHYEVSNFAKKGHRAVHNSAYWKGAAYLGVGPSAHSFKENIRQWNVSNNAIYMKDITQGKLNHETETLELKDKFNEWIMISLRTIEGLNLKEGEQRFSNAFMEYLNQEAENLLHNGKLLKKEDRLFIPQEWRFHSDGIASSLFYI